jgi:branched-chain amino acid transport system substrate-binding protein
MIRFVRRVAFLLCIALVAAAGCTGDNDNDKEASNGSKAEQTNEDITVGAIFDLSGPTADVGTPYSKGVRDYVEYRNIQGVAGHKLALNWLDFGYKVRAAEQLYEARVSEGAKVFMGWAADDTDALRPRVTSGKIPYMSAAYGETLADARVTPYNFFPGVSYSQQMRIALQYIADQNKGKGTVEVAVFHQDGPFGASPLEDGRKYVADKKLGIGYKNYPMPPTASDYLAQIGQAKAQGAKYIIIQNVAKPAAQLARDLKSQNSTAQVICLNWCADELFVKLAGPAAEKMIGVMPFAPPVVGTQGLEEINNFLKAKNSDAAAEGVHYVKGWFTMATMAEGIANALKAGGGKLDGEKIKAGLEKITEFKTGVSAPISFSAENHAGMKSAALYQVQNGTFKKIADPIEVQG